MAMIASDILQMPFLRDLSIDARLEDEKPVVCKDFFEKLGQNTTLQRFTMVYPMYYDNDESYAFQALEQNTTLQVLNLHCPDVDLGRWISNGNKGLYHALSKNNTLKILSLTLQGINDSIVPCLADVLTKHNTTLQVLDLRKNDFTNGSQILLALLNQKIKCKILYDKRDKPSTLPQTTLPTIPEEVGGC
jgi:hypothetical protein